MPAAGKRSELKAALQLSVADECSMLLSGAESRETYRRRSCHAKEEKEKGSFSSHIKTKHNAYEDLPFSCNLDKTVITPLRKAPLHNHTQLAQD